MNDSLDTIRSGEPDVIVIGAGIAGLSAALTATRAGYRTLVLDAHTAGGRARTMHLDGFAHNIGPHALYRSGHLHDLLARHAITMPGRKPDATHVRLLRDGVLTPVTMKPTDLLRTSLLGKRDRLRLMALLASVQRGKPASLVGTTVDDWLGDQPLRVRQFIDMLIRVATYTNAPSTFDAGAALQQLQMAIGTGVDYLDNGWEAMVAAMIAVIRSRGGEIVTGVQARAVLADGPSVDVEVGDRVLHASSVVLASGGPTVVERLTGARPAGRENLSPPIVSATMDLALRRPYEGIVFGLDRPLYLSPHAPVARLAPDGHGLVSVMHYLANDVSDAAAAAGVDEAGAGPGWPTHPKASLRDADRLEMRALARLSGIDDDDVLHEKYSHRLVVAHGSPTAAGGGLRGRPTTDALGIAGVHIAGDWVGPVGLLADAAAASGEAAAIAAVARIREHAA